MRTCFELDGIFPIKLEQYGSKKLFRVTYGGDIRDKLTYEQAASDLGAAIMHRAACDGNLYYYGK